jgi:hypothetical protein
MQPYPIDNIVRKLKSLPSQRIAEVEDFIDFLTQRDESRALSEAAAATAEPSFKAVWDNPDDADYDRL